MWGASRLFDELRVFLDGETSTSSLKPLLEETVSQFSSCLSDVGEDSDTSNCSILLKVQQNRGGYLENSPLHGELELRSPDEELPQMFWTELLEGKQFRWKYSCGSSQRSRKRVQPFNNLASGIDHVNEGTTKKCMKVRKNNVDQPSSKFEGEKLPTGIMADKPQGNDVESKKNSRVHDEQRSLHLSLKPQITKLCEFLLLPDNVKKMTDRFLEYVMNKHHFKKELFSIQSFPITLIWAAASLVKHKIDHKTSLTLAKECLNFDCMQTEVEYNYSLLQCLKKIFLYCTFTYNDTSSPKSSKSLNGVPCTEVPREVELFTKGVSKSIKKIQNKCEKRLNKIRLKHQEEKHRLRVVNEDEKAELERKYETQLAMTQSCSPNEVVRKETLNILNIDQQKKIEELKCQHKTSLKELEDKQSAYILKFQDWEAGWVEEVKSWAKNELRNIGASKEPGTEIDYSQKCDNVVESMIEAGAMVTETNSPSVGKTVELQSSLVMHDRANELDILVSNDKQFPGSEDHNTAENQYVSQENIISKHSHSKEQNSDGATSMTDEANRSENLGHESRDVCEKPSLGSTSLPDCREKNSDGATSMKDEHNRCAKFGRGSQDGCEMPSLGTTCLPDCENATHLEHQCSDGVSLHGKIPVEVQETTDGEGDSVSVSERQVRVELQNSLDKHDRVNELNILVSNDQPLSESDDHNTTENHYVSQENIISKHSHSREQKSDGATSMTDEANRIENLGHESRDGCEKPSLGSTSLPYCREQNSDGATSMKDEDNRCPKFCHGSQDGSEMPSLGTTCLQDCENATHLVHQCSDGVSSGVEGKTLVEVQETTDAGDSVSVLERQVRVEMPMTDNFSDCRLQNETNLNPPSSEDQISDRVSIDVPVIDGVLSSKPCQAVGLTSCQDTNSLSNPPLEQQVPDGDIPVIEQENSHAVVDNSTTNDEGGVLGNVTSAPVPRPVNVMEPLGQGKQLPSVEFVADKYSDGEIQNSSQQVQVASSSANVVPANQITVPSKQVHQLAASKQSWNLAIPSLSIVHLATDDEHQLNSVHSLPTHHSESSSVVLDKDVGQLHSNSALGLHSNQIVVHPISNSDLDSHTARRVRAQSGYQRNMSNPLEMNNHPIQYTPPSSSRRPPHFSYDPLNIEFERIQKAIEQSLKNHEHTKLRLKSDFQKELAELRRKYEVKFQEIEVEFQHTKKTLDTNLNTVYVNKVLVNVFKSNGLDLRVCGASGVQHDFSRQQVSTRPFMVPGSSSGESPVTSLRSPSIASNSRHLLPPGYNMSGTFSGISARPPLMNTNRYSNSQDIRGVELRAPAPHLFSSRRSISVSPSSFIPLQRKIPSQTPNNLRTTSPSYAFVSHQMGHRPDSAGGSSTPNVISRVSDVAPANLSRFGPRYQ